MNGRAEKTLFLETFGCQMNFLDSELVLGQLRRMGYALTSERDSADLVLFNTCSVREHAEQKVNSRLGELRQVKADRPELVIGVIGCQAEREGRALLRRFPHVDILCGPNELDRLSGLVAKVNSDRTRAVALSGGLSARRKEGDASAGDGGTGEASADGLETLDQSRAFAGGQSPIQAYVRVQRGCDKFCTFCIVPTVRGKEQSRRPEHVVAEAEMLASAGCREVTLLGQTINSYTQTDATGSTVGLAGLLERVAAVEGLVRVRFVTSYPGGFDEDILRVMADLEKVCPYLHIPAQSGSDRILRAMKRQYTADGYYRLIDRARKLVPGLSLAGDFIVGFPGETDADFAATARMVARIGYKNCFVFKYSPRPGTAAWRNLSDDVPEQVKRDRNNELLAIQADICARSHAELVGRSVRILVEGPSKAAEEKPQQAAQLTGRTTADQIVVFECPPGVEQSRLIGRLVDVRVTEATPYTLMGELATELEPATAAGQAVRPLRYKSLTVLR